MDYKTLHLLGELRGLSFWAAVLSAIALAAGALAYAVLLVSVRLRLSAPAAPDRTSIKHLDVLVPPTGSSRDFAAAAALCVDLATRVREQLRKVGHGQIGQIQIAYEAASLIEALNRQVSVLDQKLERLARLPARVLQDIMRLLDNFATYVPGYSGEDLSGPVWRQPRSVTTDREAVERVRRMSEKELRRRTDSLRKRGYRPLSGNETDPLAAQWAPTAVVEAVEAYDRARRKYDQGKRFVQSCNTAFRRAGLTLLAVLALSLLGRYMVH